MKKIIIAGLILITLPALGQQPNSPEFGQADDSRDKKSQENQQPIDITPIIGPLQALAENTKTDQKAEERKEQREIDAINIADKDLFQQSQMARFTRLIYIVTAAGVIVSVGGLAALIWTLRLQRQTMQQNRAWVLPEQSKQPGRLDTSQSPFMLIYFIPLKNFGGSPAKNVRVFHNFYDREGDPLGVTVSIQNVGFLSQGEEISVFANSAKWSEVMNYLESGELVLFSANIDYETIYGRVKGKTIIWYALCIESRLNEKELGWTAFSGDAGISYKVLGYRSIAK